MSNDTQSGSGVVGTLLVVEGKGVVRMEDRFDTDIEDLWTALTDPQRLSRWIADVEGDLRLGGVFRARFTSDWEGSGRVDVCERPTKLVVTMWDEERETTIEARLTAEADQTRLVIEDRGLPLGELAAHGAGWQAHVEDLATHLAGQARSDWSTRWLELTPSYREQAENLA
jgi:uncharacterized protein YndB with AHSA1/START domain